MDVFVIDIQQLKSTESVLIEELKYTRSTVIRPAERETVCLSCFLQGVKVLNVVCDQYVVDLFVCCT